MKTIGKAVIRTVALVMLLLAVLAVLLYQLIASIPTWMWVAAVAYLLYRNRQLLGRLRRPRQGKSRDSWARYPGAIQPPPTVVYVVTQGPALDPVTHPAHPQRAVTSAPEPWSFT